MKASRRGRVPDWFRQAIATPFVDGFVEVERCRIHFQRWGEPGKPGLMLVHGGFGHAHWWDFIAPFFTDQWCVAALDLSGMGDSGHRARYSGPIFAAEVMSVCAAAGLGERPVILGHSFGGLVALKTGLLHGKHLAGVVLVDFPIRPPGHATESKGPRIRPREIHPSLEAALKRFKLLPAQPCENDFLLDYLARHSLGKVAGGWAWKFDPRLFDGFDSGNPAKDLARLDCHTAVIYGEQSALFPRDIIAYMAGLLADHAPFIAIPQAHHHLFLDQPLAFVEALRALLVGWDRPKPEQRIRGTHARKRRFLKSSVQEP